MLLGDCFLAFGPGDHAYAGECTRAGPGVGASYSPGLLPFLAVLLGWYIFVVRLIVRNGMTEDHEIPVNPMRRYFGSVIDTVWAAALIIHLPFLLTLAVEAIRTGQFAWSFSRETSGALDVTLIICMFLLLSWLMFYYFYKHLLHGVPTIGQFVLGYRVKLPDSASPKLLAIRTLFDAAFAMGYWPFILFGPKIRQDGLLPWERYTGVRAYHAVVATKDD